MKHAWDIVNIEVQVLDVQNPRISTLQDRGVGSKPSKRDTISVLLAILIHAHSSPLAWIMVDNSQEDHTVHLGKMRRSNTKITELYLGSRGLLLPAVRQAVLLVDDSFNFRISESFTRLHTFVHTFVICSLLFFNSETLACPRFIIITNPSTSSWGCVMRSSSTGGLSAREQGDHSQVVWSRLTARMPRRRKCF